MNNNQDLHNWLSSKLASLVSWIAAAMGIGTFAGFVNMAVGLLSATWLAAQIWHWWTYTRPMNKLKLERMRQNMADAFCETDHGKLHKRDRIQ